MFNSTLVGQELTHLLTEDDLQLRRTVPTECKGVVDLNCSLPDSTNYTED